MQESPGKDGLTFFYRAAALAHINRFIALRRLDGERCEMKRLYVQPQYRGRGLARQLIRRITEDARQIGYRCMLLDTLPVLEDAVRLYRQLGFYEIPCYNDSPVESTLFFQLDL